MKGSLPFYIGVIFLVLVFVVFVYNKFSSFDKLLQISAASTRLYVTENSAEAMKRSLDAAADFSTRQAIAELGKEGEWKISGPKIEDLKKNMEEKISEKLDSFDPALINKNSVEWGRTTASIKNDNGLEISGAKPFVVKTVSGNKITFSSNGNFREKIDSKFLQMAAAGREMFDGGDWIVSEEALNTGGDQCKGKISGAKIDGFYKAKISELLKISLLCGYRSQAGIMSFSSYDESAIADAVKNILSGISADLGSKYGFKINLSPEIINTAEGSDSTVNIKVNFKTENNGFLVPIENDFAPEKLEFFTSENFKISGSQNPPK